MYYDDNGTFIGPITNNPDFQPGRLDGPDAILLRQINQRKSFGPQVHQIWESNPPGAVDPCGHELTARGIGLFPRRFGLPSYGYNKWLESGQLCGEDPRNFNKRNRGVPRLKHQCLQWPPLHRSSHLFDHSAVFLHPGIEVDRRLASSARHFALHRVQGFLRPVLAGSAARRHRVERLVRLKIQCSVVFRLADRINAGQAVAAHPAVSPIQTPSWC